MSIKDIHYRQWLNPTSDSESGAVILHIETPKLWYRDESLSNDFRFAEASLDIKDCNRSVSLDFSFETKRQLQKRIKKAKKLQHAINLLIEQLEEREKAYASGT